MLKTMKVLGLAAALSLSSMAAFAQEKLKVVYHVSEMDRVEFALNNMRNHINGVGGPENVELVLVVHGPALKAFHADGAKPSILERMTALVSSGADFEACGNTMAVQGVTLDGLMPAFTERQEGGVVRIAELQSQGYMYLRP